MKKRLIVASMIVCTALGFFGREPFDRYIGKSVKEEEAKPVVVQLPKNMEGFTFREYQQLYEAFVKELTIKGLKVKYTTMHNNVALIERKWSFDTRHHLLLTDENIVRPTEEYIVLEDEKRGTQLVIALCYTKSYIGNDLHSLLSGSGLWAKNVDQKLVRLSSSTVLTYQNLIISIKQTRTNTGKDYLTDAISATADWLTNYSHKESGGN